MVTLDALPGREIAEIVGDVVGVVARGRDLPPELRGGGMEAGYVSMLTRSRQDAITRAVEMAESAGADAILGLRFDCSEITQNMSEVVAYGTAVKLVPLAGRGAESATEDSAATPLSAASATEPPAPAGEQDGPAAGRAATFGMGTPAGPALRLAVPVERLTAAGLSPPVRDPLARSRTGLGENDAHDR